MKKRNKQWKQEKYLLKLEREYYESDVTLPKVKLDEPYKKGWEVHVTLREDISRRSDADFFLELIKIGYSKYRHINRAIDVRNIRKGLKSYTFRSKGRLHNINYTPPKKHLIVEDYNKLTLKQQKYFVWYTPLRGRPHFELELPHYYIVLKVKPHWITEVRQIDPEMISKHDKIGNKITHLCLWAKRYGANYGYSKYEVRALNKKERYKFRRKLNNYDYRNYREI